jgi:CHAT domain-containing protein
MKRCLWLVFLGFLLAEIHPASAQKHSRHFDSLLIAGEYEQLVAETSGQELTPETEIIRANALVALGNFSAAAKQLQATGAYLPAAQTAAWQTARANLALHTGRADRAIQILDSCWQHLQHTGAGQSRQAARTLALLATAYHTTGNHHEAVTYAEQARAIRLSIPDLSGEEQAAGYNDLGLVYSRINPERALEYYDMALPLYASLHGPVHPKIAIINTNMGYVYFDLKLLGDAVTNFETALGIWQTLYPQGHPNEAFVRLTLGRVYAHLNNTEAAKAYFRQAQRIYFHALGEKHPDLSSTLNQLGVMALAESAYDSALYFFQQALIANSPSFRQTETNAFPDTREFYHAQVMLFSLLQKSHALEARYLGKTLALRDLTTALTGLFHCDSLIDRIRRQNENEADKLAVGALANEVYQHGVRIANMLSEITVQSRRYREHAFYFAEKSKSAVLQEAIADAQARSFAGIPAALLNTEKELSAAIAVATQQLQAVPDAAGEVQLRQNLFRAREDYRQFVERLEREFPNYFELKFKKAMPSVSELQSKLNKQTAIVSYFLEEQSPSSTRLYTFILTAKKFRVRSRVLNEPVNRMLIGFGNSLYFRDFELYRNTGRQLSRWLWPRLPAAVREVVIIPDGPLSTLPFEALPHKRAASSFAETKYRNSRYAVSYQFSAGLLRKPGGPIQQHAMYLCAPVQFSDMPELPGTEGEVSAIAGLFDGDKQIHLFQDASEQNLKSIPLEKYPILHLATHGVADAQRPELSRLCLLPGGGEDGLLYSGEIYNLRLNARLVVLSACQTGLGKISKGEGVIGLSRALVYAGAENIVVSFWRVADESTQRLMTSFYTRLQSRTTTFREALRAAKEELRQTAPYSAPYYWAPFVLIGF